MKRSTAGFEEKGGSHEPVGAQDRPHQNMPNRYIDYFELKLLKKWPVQKGHADPPFCLPKNWK